MQPLGSLRRKARMSAGGDAAEPRPASPLVRAGSPHGSHRSPRSPRLLALAAADMAALAHCSVSNLGSALPLTLGGAPRGQTPGVMPVRNVRSEMVATMQAKFNEAQQVQDTAVLGTLYRYGKDRPAKYRRLLEAFNKYSNKYRYLSDMGVELADVKAEAERLARPRGMPGCLRSSRRRCCRKSATCCCVLFDSGGCAVPEDQRRASERAQMRES